MLKFRKYIKVILKSMSTTLQKIKIRKFRLKKKNLKDKLKKINQVNINLFEI